MIGPFRNFLAIEYFQNFIIFLEFIKIYQNWKTNVLPNYNQIRYFLSIIISYVFSINLTHRWKSINQKLKHERTIIDWII